MNKRAITKVSIIILSVLVLSLGIFFVNADSHQEQDDSTIVRTATTTESCSTKTGLCNLILHSGIVNYHNGSSFIPINISINEDSINYLDTDYSAYNEKGEYSAYYKSQSSSIVSEPVRFVNNGYTITITPNSLKFLGQTNTHKKQSFLTIQDNIGVYEGQFGDGLDLRYIYENDVLKKELVINSLQELKDGIKSSPGEEDILQLKFTVKGYKVGDESNLNNLKIGEDRINFNQDLTDVSTDKKIEFLDENNNTIYYFPQPYVEDSNYGRLMLNYTYDINRFANLIIKVEVPYSWLSNNTRIFPIIVDPTIKLQTPDSENLDDSWVGKCEDNGGDPTYQYPGNENHGGDVYLIEGESGLPPPFCNEEIKYANYMKFDLTSIPEGSTINHSELYLYSYEYEISSTTNANISANKSSLYYVDYPWSEETITWTNAPCRLSASGEGDDFGYGNSSCTLIDTELELCENDAWCKRSMSSTIKQAYSAGRNNASFMFVLDTGYEPELVWSYYSKEHDVASLRPYLNITYYGAVPDTVFPLKIGTVSAGINRGLFVSGDYAYTVGTSTIFQIWNISGYGDPVFVGNYSVNGYDVEVSGDYAFVVGNASLTYLDITDPTTPTLGGAIISSTGEDSLEGARSISIEGDYAYTVSYDDGNLVAWDISSTLGPPHKDPDFLGNITDISGSYSILSATSVFVLDNYVYVVNEESVDKYFTIYDVSGHTNPVRVGSYLWSDSTFKSSVFVSGDFAYTVGYGDTAYFEVWDISAHGNPSLVGSTVYSGSDVFVSGNFAYTVSEYKDNLAIWDISANTTPIQIG